MYASVASYTSADGEELSLGVLGGPAGEIARSPWPWPGGKLVVSKSEEAYDSRETVPNL